MTENAPDPRELLKQALPYLMDKYNSDLLNAKTFSYTYNFTPKQKREHLSNLGDLVESIEKALEVEDEK